MKTLMAFLILALLVVLQIRCSGEPGVFQTYFWTSTPGTEKLYVYVDGRRLGALPRLASAPDVRSDSLERVALYTPLPSGSYRVEVKNDQGLLRVAETLEISRRGGNMRLSTSFSDHQGNGKCVWNEDRLVEELTY
ncbi:hypothetical protein [Chitinophaga parva]|uniref:hypothetical protein n=1 Tax=Chitinophaga parva TaxID=2169414 RepID=UPI001057417C|nr:hypothetical protein [Chitinophaga parva]